MPPLRREFRAAWLRTGLPSRGIGVMDLLLVRSVERLVPPSWRRDSLVSAVESFVHEVDSANFDRMGRAAERKTCVRPPRGRFVAPRDIDDQMVLDLISPEPPPPPPPPRPAPAPESWTEIRHHINWLTQAENLMVFTLACRMRASRILLDRMVVTDGNARLTAAFNLLGSSVRASTAGWVSDDIDPAQPITVVGLEDHFPAARQRRPDSLIHALEQVRALTLFRFVRTTGPPGRLFVARRCLTRGPNVRRSTQIRCRPAGLVRV